MPDALSNRTGAAPVELLITHASELLTCRVGTGRGARGDDLERVEVIADGAVAVDAGRIVAVGETSELERRFAGRTTLDATGRLVTPGLVDPHTHLVHAGTRHLEWGARVLGARTCPGAEHGIAATRRATAAASTEQLAHGILTRLDTMLAHGTTTAEAKSGYGQSPADELRLLEALAATEHPVELAVTYLGAHVSPGPATHRAFVEEVIAELGRARRVAEYCDVCCDPIGFTRRECERIAAAACELGFGLRVHADQTGPREGAELAIGFGAASADHLEYVSDRAIAMFADSPTVAILLPTVSYHTFALVRDPGPTSWGEAPHAWLGERFRRLVNGGALVALATDYNPGSSPTLSMQAVMQAAARLYRLGYAEIWNMSTINAAVSLGRNDRIGSLEAGKQADLVLWDVPTHELVINQFGTNLVSLVIKAGEVVHATPAVSRPTPVSNPEERYVGHAAQPG
ncbi:MAG: imidazolonepropionase [Thermoleophilia bacterium]|nr:imidazolonepropionase [Thermoleophilia bacterium]